MRIVFVINSLIYGGAETQVIALSRALAARGHAVAIYTLQPENPRAAELHGSNVHVVADCKRWKFDLALLRRLRRFIREFEADIVHGFLLEGNLYASLCVAGTDIPALASERNDSYRWPVRHRLGLLLSRRFAAGLVANSHAGARFAQPLFQLPDADVHVVWNGIALDHEEREARARVTPAEEFFGSPDVKVACLVGQIRPQKDQCLARRVAKALVERHPAWRVLLVGDCLPQTESYKESVLRLHAELQLGQAAVFAGLRTDVREIIRGCNVLFSTSTHEGFPNVVIEAMAVGTPVVSTEYSDIRMILPDLQQVVATRAPEDLAAAIVRADEQRDEIRRRQRRWLEANATIAVATERLETVYGRYAAAAHA